MSITGQIADVIF